MLGEPPGHRVRFTDNGLLIKLDRSKSDREGQGAVIGVPFGSHAETCPARVLRAWLDASREMMAAEDCRAFGDSAGDWRCDGAEDDGTVRITLVMLDFTYPGPRGENGQIMRLDVSGRYDPTTSILDLEGSLGIWPMDADAEEIASSAQAPASMGITLCCAKIKPPPPPH